MDTKRSLGALGRAVPVWMGLALVAACGGAAHVAPPAPRAATRADLGGDTVMVGYGTQRRRSVTGSVGSLVVSADEGARVRDVAELIDARVPGVEVRRIAGGGYAIRIRGTSTLQGSEEPLVVIDGMAASLPGGAALSGLVPGDIARIDVLKDASASAIYGSRAANGVLLVTTRHPPAPRR
jgi:TonB-dependent starch-binding outer membrane protein SusC